ncbi:AAA family ATPase [Leucobacter viscericola]|uniref:AAA family ATPase n=1 Tax=Leucobacter viscericola TaxID=2714935 RepID=A0A6G7XJB9_9MICO|nr:AAA family ATPase [Leucobacter viscericola]
MQPPEEVGRPKSILLYGTHGTRKTSIAGSIIKAPGFKKVLFIDIDNGAEVLMNDPVIKEAIVEGRLQILQVSSLDGDAFVKINAVVDEITKTDFGYDAVILDTLDVAQDVAEKVIKKKYEGSKNTFGVFGDLGIWTDEIVRKLHESKHFMSIVTCHSKEQTLESGAHRILPRLSGSSKDAIGGIPSIVAYSSTRQIPKVAIRTSLLVSPRVK